MEKAMPKLKSTDLFKIAEKKIPQFYPLNRAVRWIAFGEMPIEEEYADILYSDPITNVEEIELFSTASQALQASLREGSIKSYASSYSYHSDDDTGLQFYPPVCDEHGNVSEHQEYSIEIDPKFWAPKSEIKWEANKLSAYDESLLERNYVGIGILTQQLMKKFSTPLKSGNIIAKEGESNTKNIGRSTAGRKPEYPWDEFYIKIISIANTPDGLPDTQAELIETMLQWCAHTWGEGNEPGHSTIKNRISEIYKKADN